MSRLIKKVTLSLMSWFLAALMVAAIVVWGPGVLIFHSKIPSVRASSLSYICSIGSNTNSTTSCTGEQTGDLLLVSATIHNGGTAPTTATNFTSINTVTNSAGSGSTRTALNAGWKVASSNTEGSGTWTGATEVVMMVYRGQSSSPIGNNATSGGNNSGTLVTYAADTLSATDGSSWFAGFVVRNTADLQLFNPPTGMTNRVTGGNNLGSPYAAGNDINGPTSSNWPSTNETGFGVSAKFTSIVIEIKAAPIITVGSTGTQVSNLSIPSTSNYLGGAFTFIRDAGSDTVTSITIHKVGTAADSAVSNLILWYKQETTCSTSIPSGATQYNSTGVNFFSGAATASGAMAVGTSQICVYLQVDVSSGANNGDTIDMQISDASADVTVSVGSVGPVGKVALAGTTTLGTVGPTTDQLLRGGEYFTGGSKQPYYWAN